jgi:hypothetical protein
MKIRHRKNGRPQRFHGFSKTRLYRIWQGIVQRCETKSFVKWERYGGRGIKMCKQWRENFLVFRKFALKNGYTNKLEIDRKNNNKHYTPKNCRFVTHKVNCQNRFICKVKDESIAQMKGLRLQGVSWRKISKIVHMDVNTIRRSKKVKAKVWRNIPAILPMKGGFLN